MSADQAQRNRAIEGTSLSFAVEASAGTGKTSLLIRRILHCVLERGPSGPPIPLPRLCAITFTEKAAGEMKIRLRQEFERRAVMTGAEGELARQALLDLESASISTFHSFAVSLLKERPIEAGLDPRFSALDDVQSRLFFREVWDTWLHRALEDRRPPLEQALRLGLSLEALRDAADTVRLHAHTVRRLRLPIPLSEEEVNAHLEEKTGEGRELLSLCTNPGDKLLAFLEDALAWMADPRGDMEPRKPGNKGSAGSWSGQKETVSIVRDFVRDVVDFRLLMRALPGQRALDAMLRLMVDEFLPEWERQKRSRGCLDFDDQLWFARDLLASSRAARVEFQRRYAALLVDEFQDTDAVQWEMIRLLAIAPDAEGEAQGRITPGRLFIVGDPKQSIYRFRGADIETYAEVTGPAAMEQLGLTGLELTTNFRSVPPILQFVDEAFRDVMTGSEPFQSRYLAFGGQGARAGTPGAPCVHLMGDRSEHGELAGSGPEYCRMESARIAQLISSMPGDGNFGIQEGQDGRRRAPLLREVAILLPVLTHAETLEDALRDAGIPYVLEGGKFYYARNEVSSAITVMRSIANPNDSVALYGALRSIFFGLSDEDLLRARLEDCALDYRGTVPAHSRLAQPYRILHGLHARRHERPAAETFEDLLQQTGAREVLAPSGAQSLANLNKLTRTMRALQSTSHFSEVVELVGAMDEEETAESESRIMEEHSDAVRIMSIHRAKGLDFPVVIVAGLGMSRRSRSAKFLADAHEAGVFGLSLGSKESGLQTPGWNDLMEKDKEREEAELIRLLYVALTRARDHLVLSTYTRGKKIPDTDQWSAGLEQTRLQALAEFLSRLSRTGFPGMRFLDSSGPAITPVARAADPGAPRCEWRAELAARYDELDRLLAGTPAARSFLAAATGKSASNSDEMPIDPARDRGVRIGLAFHAAMYLLDLARDPNSAQAAQEAGVRQRLDGAAICTLQEMLERTLDSALMQRARASLTAGRRIWRELPYVRSCGRNGAEIEEGKIDLLIEEPDGCVLVDYKTDLTQPEGEILGKYEAQLKAYASSLRSLGITVKSAHLLLARSGHEVEIPL